MKIHLRKEDNSGLHNCRLQCLNQVSCADNFTDNLSSWDSMCSLFLYAFKNGNLINALLSCNINAPSDDEVSHVVN